MPSQGDESGPFPYRILFVDDDVSLAGLYAELLRGQGYVVHVAEGGFKALAYLRRALPDLVISDLCMPGMSGMELLAIIRQRFPQLPLMAVSAADILPSDALTADAAISREELAVQQLFDTVARLLRRHAAPISLPGRLPWIAQWPVHGLYLTCAECLRTFHPPAEAVANADITGVHICTCVYCGHEQSFLVGDESEAA